MLLKIIAFITIIFLIYLFFFKKKREDTVSKHSSSTKKLEGDTMVECSSCATFVSHEEALIKDGQFFCSKECAGVLR